MAPKILTREQALRVDGRRKDTVEFPELNGALILAELATGPSEAIMALEAAAVAGDPKARRAQLLLMIEHGVIDEKGEPLFDAASASTFYDKLPITALQRLMEKLPKDDAAIAAAKAAREKAANEKNGALLDDLAKLAGENAKPPEPPPAAPGAVIPSREPPEKKVSAA